MPVRMTIIKKQEIQSVTEDVEERTLVYCWQKCELVQILWKTVWMLLKKLKRGQPYDIAIPYHIAENISKESKNTV